MINMGIWQKIKKLFSLTPELKEEEKHQEDEKNVL